MNSLSLPVGSGKTFLLSRYIESTWRIGAKRGPMPELRAGAVFSLSEVTRGLFEGAAQPAHVTAKPSMPIAPLASSIRRV